MRVFYIILVAVLAGATGFFASKSFQQNTQEKQLPTAVSAVATPSATPSPSTTMPVSSAKPQIKKAKANPDRKQASPKKPVVTVQNKPAELQMNDGYLRLQEGSTLNVIRFDRNYRIYDLEAGTLSLNIWKIRPGQTYEISTPAITFRLTRPGIYRIQVENNGLSTIISIHSGKGIVYTNEVSYPVHAPYSYRFLKRDVRSYETLKTYPTSGWVHEVPRPAYHVHVENETGTWVTTTPRPMMQHVETHVVNVNQAIQPPQVMSPPAAVLNEKQVHMTNPAGVELIHHRRQKEAAEKAKAERVAQEKAATEKAEADRIAQEKATAEKAESDRVAREKAEADKIAQEKAAAEKAEADRVAQEKAAAEKAEADRVAQEKAAAEKAEADRVAQEKAAAEKAEADRIAEEKAAAEKAEADRVAEEKAAAEKAEAEKSAQATPEQKESGEEKASEEKSAEGLVQQNS